MRSVAGVPTNDDALWSAFVTPPASAKPRVWWHWMNGNVDEEGIRLDLEWMARIGIGGAQAFEGGMNTPQLVDHRVVFGSPAWDSAMRYAATTADALGLELTVATSAGWSAAGAPWVEPVDAMKKIVWSETVVSGGPVSLAIAPLPTIAGRYLDVPRWGSPSGDPVLSRDIITLAIPALAQALTPNAASTSTGPIDHGVLTDGSFAAGVVLPRDLASASREWVSYSFAQPTTVSAVTLGLPGPRGFGSPPPVRAILESSRDGRDWKTVVEIPATQSPVRSRSFTPVTARWFRVALEGAPHGDAIPPMDAGVVPLPFPPPRPETLITQFVLYSAGRVSASEEKAGFGTTLDYRTLSVPPEVGVDPSAVLDLTDHVIDGTLTWDAPPGLWRILRFGYSLTGHQNGPAPAEATGLEVDKLDAGRVESYLRRWLGQIRDAVGGDLIGQRGIQSLLSDSIESGPQNWTESLPEEFLQRRGYSLLPWLPVVAGYTVADSDQSDAVLWDLRATIAELYAEAYYGTIARIAHEWGLTYYAEALEDHRPQLGDDFDMRARADIPMGAMWTFDEADGPAPTYVADLRGASSVAHVHGKAFTGAESMSAFGHPYVYSPRLLKPIADLELALGVTRFCIHTSPHQPSTVRAPGIALTPHLGQTFTRNETWAEQAGPWISYLARSSQLLNSGAPVADIAYFFGEDAPLTAVFGDVEPDDVPSGFAWDFVSAEALTTALTVQDDGRLVSRGGARYSVLYLGGTSERMTLGTVRRLAALVDAGATVVGAPPVSSPSAADDDREFAAAVAQLWTSPRVHTAPLGAVLGDPDWIAPGLDVVHRAVDDADLYFVRNPTSQQATLTASFRVRRAGAEWWDAVSGTRVRADATEVDGRTAVRLELAPYGSGFVVLREARPAPTLGPAVILTRVDHWSTATPDDEDFSGTSAWSANLLAEPSWFDGGRLVLALDGVHDLAEVIVNGRSAGIAWTAPFEVDVTDVLTPGDNRIEIAVTNPWANRLIADAAHPETATTQLTMPIYDPAAARRPWGLRGPATLLHRAAGTAPSAY